MLDVIGTRGAGYDMTMAHDRDTDRARRIRRPRWALVTGASSGIGLAVARRLAARDVHLVLVAQNTQRLNHAAAGLPGDGERRVVAADLASVDAVEAIIAPAIAGLPIEMLVNAAGVGSYRRFLEEPPINQRRLLQVNYLATQAMIRRVLPGMVEAGWGRVVNIASMSAVAGAWGHSAYAPTKAALVALTRSLEAEHADEGVRFSAVLPGIIDTPYFRKGTMRRLWPAVRGRAIPADRVGRAVERLIGRPRVAVYVPWYYRALEWLAAISPTLAVKLVGGQSRPADTLNEAGPRTDTWALPDAEQPPPAPPAAADREAERSSTSRDA